MVTNYQKGNNSVKVVQKGSSSSASVVKGQVVGIKSGSVRKSTRSTGKASSKSVSSRNVTRTRVGKVKSGKPKGFKGFKVKKK